MPKIFISYRREDAAGFAGRLTDALEARYGAGTVFRDIDDIPPGKDFVEALDAALNTTDIFIPLIGRHWLTAAGRDGPRLQDPQDYVRREVAMALEHGMQIIPALLEGARMPAVAELPAELADLPRRQAIVLDDRSWNDDVQKLMRAIERNASGGDEIRSIPAHGTSDGELHRAKRRGLLWLALFAALSLAVFAGWYMSRLPNLGGEWRLDDGSRWRVHQDGAKLQIEEVHYQTREVWRAGTGRITREGIEVDLRYKFAHAVSLHGMLRLSEDGRALDGVLTEAPTERKVAFNLRR